MKKLVQSVFFVAMLLVSSSLVAQKNANVIEIMGVDFEEKLSTPQTTDVPIFSQTQSDKWASFTLKFKVTISGAKASVKDDGKWLDDVTLEWRGLTKPGAKWLKFAKDVKYRNVGEGIFYATVLIDPITLKRYLDEGKALKKDFVMMATFKVGSTSQTKGRVFIDKGRLVKKLPKPITAAAFTKEGLEELSHLLKDRSETPWAQNQFGIFPEIVKSNR